MYADDIVLLSFSLQGVIQLYHCVCKWSSFDINFNEEKSHLTAMGKFSAKFWNTLPTISIRPLNRIMCTFPLIQKATSNILVCLSTNKKKCKLELEPYTQLLIDVAVDWTFEYKNVLKMCVVLFLKLIFTVQFIAYHVLPQFPRHWKMLIALLFLSFLGTVPILTPRISIISLREQALWQLMPESCHCLNCTENHVIHYIVVCWKVKIILLPIMLSMLYILVYSSHFKLFTLHNLVRYL